MNEPTLVDTGFWIAVFDPRDQWHRLATENVDLIDLVTLVVPWPILYETLRTHFARRADWVIRLDQRLKKPGVVFIEDEKYRDDAYSLAVEWCTRLRRPISMVDMLCRLILADKALRIRYLVTTNRADFHDVCVRNNVDLLVAP